jgi:arginine decarboxylase
LWSIEQSKYIYGIGRSDLYFLDIDSQGRLCLRIGNTNVSLSSIVERFVKSSRAGCSSFTLRIPLFAAERAASLTKAFRDVMKELSYRGRYLPLFPMKVNQHYDVVRAVLASDPKYGVEVGSKTEFLMARSILGQDKSRLIVCNGIKDRKYLRMIENAHDAGHSLLMCVENVPEVHLLVKSFPHGGIPIGIRVIPYVEPGGHWGASGGRHSKFGLTIHDLKTVIDVLRNNDLKKDVCSIHGHIGSQVTDLGSLRELAVFMMKVYSWLERERGLTGLKMVDLGGGLPVDYEGIHHDVTLDSYAKTVVETVSTACGNLGLTMVPSILTETGRAVTAHSSMILVRVLGHKRSSPAAGILTPNASEQIAKWTRTVQKAKDIAGILRAWSRLNKEIGSAAGNIDALEQREQVLAHVKEIIRKRIVEFGQSAANIIPPEWSVYPDVIALGNFSVFNSCLDHILADQHFPVIPITGLDREPETLVRLVDMTCDSDGEISTFVRRENIDGAQLVTSDSRPLTGPKSETAVGIPIPSVEALKGSYFLIALTGAYQEAMASDPSLLGKLPDAVVGFKDNQVFVACKNGDLSLTSKLRQNGFEVGSFDPYYTGEED